MVLAAPRGREVRAVYHGRVAFADWLAGMGLLVIVDHGEGYLTLYGYDEEVTKVKGERVTVRSAIYSFKGTIQRASLPSRAVFSRNCTSRKTWSR